MIAVTGDVHGCIKTLESAVNKVLKKHTVSSWYFIGDIIDRGKANKEVTKFIMNLSQSIPVKLIRGNHEDMLIDYIAGTERYELNRWIKSGGEETIMSFTKKKYNKIEIISKRTEIVKYFEEYADFFNSSLIYEEFNIGDKKYLVSHAGVNHPELAIENQNDAYDKSLHSNNPSFLWDKTTIYNNAGYRDYILIFGHTPIHVAKVTDNVKKPYVIKNKNKEIKGIAIDTGAVYGYALSTVIIDEKGEFKWETQNHKD